MKIISRICACAALSFLAGCSAFQAAPSKEECAGIIEPLACPVCPSPQPELEQCPEPQVIEKVVAVPEQPPAPAATTAGKQHLPIVGAIEWATVEPGNIRMEARIDTGAATTSIHAEDQQLVEKDGKRWVSFSLLDPDTGEKVFIEQRLRRTVLIKQSDEEETQRRYVVRLWLTLGDKRSLIDVTLTDREHMEYPLLIGRNLLIDNMIVDVSRKHTASR